MSHISKDQMLSPGPGAYDGNVNAIKDKMRIAGFGKSQRTGFVGKEDKLKPGPGNYDIPDTRKSKAFKMGLKLSMMLRETTPGPGNYDPNINVIKDSTRNVKLAKASAQSSMIHSKSTKLIPGPGQYSQTNEFGKNAQSFSIRGKHKDTQNTQSPGPGHYEPSHTVSKERIQSAIIKGG